MSQIAEFLADKHWLIWAIAYSLALAGSELFVPAVLSLGGQRDQEMSVRHAGRMIGKLENFLIVTFVILTQYTALALVFAAKGISRAEAGDKGERHEKKKLGSYYILGTLANFTWSLAIAAGARFVVSWANGK
jgi:hypothetical protein